ncbi:MAG: FHA domain-containing protein [Acidobacteria bacterium]|nr:FHA domain-containing protein [Acidobacteriota bacterium]
MGPKNRFTIGRDRTCDIPIADDSVSRLHAELTLLDGGKYFLTDCHSSNSTYLIRDGSTKKITQELVAAGDRVQFGDIVLGMSDILDAIRPRLVAAPQNASAPVRTGPLPDSVKLVRCECGTILPHGKRCPSCGA